MRRNRALIAAALAGATALAAGPALLTGGPTNGSWALAAAPARSGGDAMELARRAMSGDGAAPSAIESLFEPLLARKDLWSLDEATGGREAGRLAGRDAPGPAVRWLVIPTEGAAMRLLTVDFGLIAEPSGSGKPGYVAYGIIERGEGGTPKVSWYHDLGRKLPEQGGAAWHPLAARRLGGASGEGKVLA